jgi:hypothetical protein
MITLGRPAPDLEWAIIRPDEADHAIANGWHVAWFAFSVDENAAHEREDAPPSSESGS